MRYVWLAIIALSGIPVLVFAAYFSPWLLLLVGVDGWLERVGRLRPYRWWLLLSLVACALSASVYVARFG